VNALVLLAGLAALVSTAVSAAKALARRRTAEAAIAARLETLRPADHDAAVEGVLLGPTAGPQFLRVRFARTGLHVSRRMALLCGGLYGLGVLALVLSGRPLVGLVAAAAGAAGAAAALQFLAAVRAAALVRELPFLLDGVRQHLIVGSSLQLAVARSVEAAGPDVRLHFTPVVRRIDNGATVAESLAWLAERLQVAEIDMLSAAVQTNLRFGGPIAPALVNLVQILRDRARVTRELKAATAETRLSGLMLAGLPVVAIVGVAFMNPAYAAFLFQTPTGHSMLAFAFGFQAIGCLAMARIMRLDF
jgi:tight adherence protein B